MTSTGGDGSVAQQLSTHDIAHERARKRQKIEIACDVCKSRKSKCDGARPVCGPCSRRRRGRDAHLCNYRSEKTNGTPIEHADIPSTGYAGGTNTTPQPSVPRAPQLFPMQQGQANLHVNLHQPGPLLGNGQVEQDDDGRDGSPAPSDGSASDRDADAMGCVDGWGLRSGLLGTASGASFTQQIRNAADGIYTPDRGAKGSRSAHVTTKLPKLRRKRDAEKNMYELQIVLPQRKTADHLFEVYWAYSDVIFPWLDETEIRQQYATVWSPDDDANLDERVFHCTLNLMFALATKLDPHSRPEAREKLAKIYYERARDLLSFNLLDLSHFQILQALLLMGQYLQSTNMPRQCFQIIGLAIWVAQDLGLHLPETTCVLQEPSERELARRVWHGLIILDKIAAMTFGRPARISKSVVQKAVYPLPGDISVGSSSAPDGSIHTPAKYDFFIAFCKLHDILGDVLETFYGGDEEVATVSRRSTGYSLTTKTLDQVFKIESTLSSWHSAVPSHLKAPLASVDGTTTGYTIRQSNILELRYQYSRLLLFRSFFTMSRQLDTSTAADTASLEFQTTSIVVTECQIRCVQAAQSIIDLIATGLGATVDKPQRDLLPSWWFTISYIFSSSLVLFAALMFPSISNAITSSTLHATLERGYQVLQQYHAYTKSARRCSSVLRSVHKKIVSSRQAAPASSSDSSQLLANLFDGESIDFGSVSTDFSFMDFDPNSEDLSWLETNMFV